MTATTTTTTLLALALGAALASGCGDDTSGGPDGGGNTGDCELGGQASNDRYLPYDVGNVWRFRATKVSTGEVSTKRTEVTEEITPDGETEPVTVQITTKSNGTTETWQRLDGDVLRRYKQIDYDETGAIERSNVYDPSRVRLDETAAHLADGATWTEEFENIEYDPAGIETGRLVVTETWTILGVDVPCESPLGTFECLHVQRMASDADGGSVAKEYWYARGLGKVREEGDTIEELLGCLLE
jgi:hypothetical protein